MIDNETTNNSTDHVFVIHITSKHLWWTIPPFFLTNVLKSPDKLCRQIAWNPPSVTRPPLLRVCIYYFEFLGVGLDLPIFHSLKLRLYSFEKSATTIKYILFEVDKLVILNINSRRFIQSQCKMWCRNCLPSHSGFVLPDL